VPKHEWSRKKTPLQEAVNDELGTRPCLCPYFPSERNEPRLKSGHEGLSERGG